MAQPTDSTKNTRPLVVDLDGTLVRSDLLLESFFALLSSAPLTAFRALFSLRKGRAAFKATIAQAITPDFSTLPYNELLIVWLKAEKAKGRPLYLASASHESYVQAVAHHVGIFSGVFGSDGATNLKSRAKAAALVKTFGAKGFDYVGNEAADLAVWQEAAGVIVTTEDVGFETSIRQQYPEAVALPQPRTSKRDYIKALRPHQWLKNVLIFVPMLAAHTFDAGTITESILAFVGFSLCASSGYILNDLLDLRSDRQHHSKRARPFAAGRIPLKRGVQMMVTTLAAALVIGLMLPSLFLAALIAYYILTLAYSAFIKRRMMLDVIVLSLLYGLRLVAGGAALAIPLSAWLLSFSTFFFLSLALIKRCSELVVRQNLGHGDPAGRDYRLSDLPMLSSMAAAAGYVAALTSGLYINSTNVAELYSHAERLWAVPIVLLFWISRMLLLTHRGQMHDDPVLFAARDRVSILCGAVIFLVLFASM